MALIDNQNKIIYWDEVNWQWLPFVTIRTSKATVAYRLRYKDYDSLINSKEVVIEFLENKGYKFLPLSNLGITEISLGYYLYNGYIYHSDGRAPIKVLPKLLSTISGKSVPNVAAQLRGQGVVTKERIEEIMYGKFTTIEFRGKAYSNYSEFSNDYGISTSYLYKKLSEGLTLEEVLDVYDNSKTTVVDHEGVEHRSIKDMCKAWGITRGVYTYRKNRGWSLKKILTTPVNKKHQSSMEYKDFNGKIFSNIKLMAKEHGVSYAAMMYHIKKGKSPAKALGYLLMEEQNPSKVKDFLGNSFPSQVKMLEYWKVNYYTFHHRIRNGWSLEESLTGRKGSKN